MRSLVLVHRPRAIELDPIVRGYPVAAGVQRPEAGEIIAGEASRPRAVLRLAKTSSMLGRAWQRPRLRAANDKSRAGPCAASIVSSETGLFALPA